MTFLARVLMHQPLVRQIVRMRGADISGGRSLHTWNDLLDSYPGIFGVKTGHTSAAGWSQVAAARRRGVTIYATLLGSPDRDTRNADLAKLLDWGFSRYRPAAVVVRGRPYARAAVGYGRRAPGARRVAIARAVGPHRPPAGPAGSSPRLPPACPCTAASALGAVLVYQQAAA